YVRLGPASDLAVDRSSLARCSSDAPLCPAVLFFFSSRRRHTISKRDWSSDVCSSDLSGIVDDDTADSWVDVKGNDWLIEGNTGTASPVDGFQTHEILDGWGTGNVFRGNTADMTDGEHRSEEHTSELQSRFDLVCRLLLEKKNI